eukprot:gene18885-24680_t
MANIKLISKKVENFLSGNSTEITSADIAKLGGRKGQWRLDMRLQAKSNSIQNLGRKILDELRTARRAFILDDILLIGLENVFIGLSFLQQWDDLIITQRRYLFLVYPEVKPSNLISLYDKIVIIQIASLLNLTIDRLSSSLGLTLLHVTMCSGHTEISKWLIHNYPQLLTYKDLQHDTPIMIALKECAHFLILFGQQKDNLDDGTSFSDASYSTYYPEIEDYRNDTDTNGEFIVADMLAYSLTASEAQRIIK